MDTLSSLLCVLSIASRASANSHFQLDRAASERAQAGIEQLDRFVGEGEAATRSGWSAALEELSTALAELEAMPMTLALLAASGAGKAVNAIKKGETSLAPRAKMLVDRWKALAQTASS